MGCGCSSDIKSSRTEITLPRRTNIIKQSNSETKQKCVNVLVTLTNGQTRDHYSNLIIKMRKPLFVYLGEECVHHQGYRQGQRVEFNWKVYSAAEERFINRLYDLGRRQKLTENIILQHFTQFTSGVRSETKYSNQPKVIFVEGPRMYSDYTFIAADPVHQPSNITNIDIYSESWTNITTPMFNDIRQSRFNDERQRRDRVRDFTEEILLLIGNTPGSEDMTKSIYEQVLQQLQLDLIARLAEHRNFSDEELQNLLREYIREIQQNIRFQDGHPGNSTNAGNIFVIPISTTINAENQSGDSDERNSWKQKDTVWRNIIRTEITSLRHLCETKEEKILLITLENEYLHQIMKNIANKNTDFDYKEGTLTKSFNERKNQMKQKAQDERIQNNTEMKQSSDLRKKRHKVLNVKTETDASQTSNDREKRKKKKRKEGMSTNKDPSETSEYMDKKARTVDMQTDADSKESPANMNKMRKKERKDGMSTDTHSMESSDDLDKKARTVDMQTDADSKESPANMNKISKKGRKDGMSTDTHSMESSDDLDKKARTVDMQTDADSKESPANMNKMRKVPGENVNTDADAKQLSEYMIPYVYVQTDKDGKEFSEDTGKIHYVSDVNNQTETETKHLSDNTDEKQQALDITIKTDGDSEETSKNLDGIHQDSDVNTQTEGRQLSENVVEIQTALGVNEQTDGDSKQSSENVDEIHTISRWVHLETKDSVSVPNNIVQTDTEPVQLQEIFQKIDEDVIAELTQVQKDTGEETNGKSKDEVLDNHIQEQKRSIFQEYDRKEDHIYELEVKDVQTITKEEIEENNQKLKESIEDVEDIEEITRKVKEHKQAQQKLVLRAQKGGEVIKDIQRHLQDMCEESQIDVPGLSDGDAYLENSSQTVQETDRVEEELLNDLNNMQRNTAHPESTEDRRKLLNEFLDTEIETILKMEEEKEIQKDQQVASSVNDTNEESTHSVSDEEEYEKSLLNDGDFECKSSDEESENKGKESEDSLSLKNREERQEKLRQELINLKDEVIQNVNGPLSEDELKQKLKDHRSKQQALLDKLKLSKERKRRRLMEEKSRFSSETSDENEIYTDSQIPSSMTQDSDTQTETLKVLMDNEEDFVKKFCEIGVDTHCEPDGDQPIDTMAVVEKYLKAQTNVMERAASDKEKEIHKLREKVADLQEKLKRKDKDILKEEVEKLHEHIKSEIIENTEMDNVKHKLESHQAKRNAFLQQFEEKKIQRQKKLQDTVKKAMQSEQQQDVGESPSEIENDVMPKEDGSTSPDRHTPETRKMTEDGTNETFENLSRKNEKLQEILRGTMNRKRTVIDIQLRPNERSNTIMFPRDTDNPEE